jgi:SAM-dependent methyltransferase
MEGDLTKSDDSLFREYARFYDLLYADKDYEAECHYLRRIFASNGVGDAGSVLDLGCGTGGHVLPLQRAGFAVTGVDRSQDMISLARNKAENLGSEPTLLVADVRELDLGRTFDAVISMFAVVGYQLRNQDLAGMFAAARRHLREGGHVVFDAWFGPAVLASRPEERRKSVVLDDGTEFVRIAKPTIDVIAQTVQVDYALVRADGVADRSREVSESHTMRFLFAQEIAYFLYIAGFEIVSFTPFMRESETPTESDWNVAWVARAI